MSYQELVQQIAAIAKKIDSLGVYISQNQEQLDAIKEKTFDIKDSISGLMSTTLPIGVQWTSAVASVISVFVTAITAYVIFKIKENIQKSNHLAVVRKNLLLLYTTIGPSGNNRAIATDLFKHFKGLLNEIAIYKKDYEKCKTLKDRIDTILSLPTMGRMDVRTNIEEILIEIGECYA